MVVTACWVSSIRKQFMLGLNSKEKLQRNGEKNVTAFKWIWEYIYDLQVSGNNAGISADCLKDTKIQLFSFKCNAM